MPKAKTIDYRFKILYAVAITMVVCSHIFNGTSVDGQPVNYELGFDLFYHWFPYGSLQLAIFAFASGYFFRVRPNERARTYVWRKFKQLIIPMYLYNFLYGWIVRVTALQGFSIGGYVTWDSLLLAPLYDGNQFRYNVGGWFVVPLFLIQSFNLLVRRFFAPFESETFHVPEWAYFVFYFSFGLLGNTLAIKGYNTGWWLLLVRPLHLLPFFALGSFYRHTLEKYDTIKSIWLLPACLLAKYLIAAWVGYMPDYAPMWCNNFVNGPLLPILVGYIGIIFWLRLARILEASLGRTRLVNLIADNTYSIMINQFAGFMLVKGFFALVATITPFLGDFNFAAWHSDIWWYYEAFGLHQSLLLYLAAGLTVPILIQKGLNFATSELAALDKRHPQSPPGLKPTKHHKLTIK
ncbi:acyltransferase [bacterium]|nr:acyltransferase [bacterium]